MGNERMEEDRNRLTNTERVIFELLLIVYPLTFITIDWIVDANYVWLGISIVTGMLSFILFSKKDYSSGLALSISILLAMPLFLIGVPIVIVVFLACYTFWRIHDNFAVSKLVGWPFLVLNPVVFLSFYLMAKPFFVNNNPGEVMQRQLILFAMTTVLYFIIRYVVVGMVGRQLNGFSAMDAGKLYGGLLGLGVITYIAVFFLLIPSRNALIAIVGFLFGDMFTFILKSFTPALEAFIALFDAKRAEVEEEPEIDLGYSEWNMQDKIEVIGNSVNTSPIIITSIASVGLVILFLLLRKRKRSMATDDKTGSVFRRLGRTKEQPVKRLAYDYSKADGNVRNAFKEFEELAQSSKAPRLQGETVKEWFTRMGWKDNVELFTTYDKARYGKDAVSEKEGLDFIEELDKLKRTFFKNDV